MKSYAIAAVLPSFASAAFGKPEKLTDFIGVYAVDFDKVETTPSKSDPDMSRRRLFRKTDPDAGWRAVWRRHFHSQCKCIPCTLAHS